MIIEAIVAIGSGLVANSLVLVAFGIDSVIELASAAVLLWRLNVELRHGQSFAEDAEKAASRIGGALLFLLAAYVVTVAVRAHDPPRGSWANPSIGQAIPATACARRSGAANEDHG
jgi:hypothetical protein